MQEKKNFNKTMKKKIERERERVREREREREKERERDNLFCMEKICKKRKKKRFGREWQIYSKRLTIRRVKKKGRYMSKIIFKVKTAPEE